MTISPTDFFVQADKLGDPARLYLTYVELKQIAIPDSAGAVLVGGREVVGDDGGGIFVWDSNDMSTEVAADVAEGIYVPPNADKTGKSGAWVRQFDAPYNILWFGGKFGSGEDNTTALQSAIDTLPESGGTIYFPTGGTGVRTQETSYYYFDSGVTINTKSVELRGEGNAINSPVNLVYTGTGTFITAGVYGLHCNTIGFRGVNDTDDKIYVAGSVAIKSEGVLRLRETRFTKFEMAVDYNGGFYHEFHNVEIIRCRFGFDTFNANNLTFIGGRFTYFEIGVRCNGGTGPISFYGTSFENFQGRAVTSSFGAEIDVSMWGCYFENYPGNATPKGIGADGANFDSGTIFVLGSDRVAITMQGCLISTKGIFRVSNAGGEVGKTVTVNAGGNTWLLFNTTPNDTLDSGWYFGNSRVLLTGIDKFEGTPPAGATFIPRPATGSMYNTWDDLTNHIVNGATFTEAAILPKYAISNLPAPADKDGGMVIVTDDVGGEVPAFSDNTNWRRVTDRAIVSTT